MRLIVPISLTGALHFLPSSISSHYHKPQWETLSAIPQFPRQEHTTVALSNSIYIIGGILPDANFTTTSLVQRYSISTKKWYPVSPLPTPLNHPNAAVIADKIYVLGGLSELNADFEWVATPSCFVYDSRLDQWSSLPPMPAAQARGSAAMGVYGSKVYLAGGMRSLAPIPGGVQDTVAQVTVYDIVTKEWKVLPSLEEGRDHAGAAVVNGVFYVLGGRYQGQRNVRDTVFALDLKYSQKGWKSLARLPTPRGGVAAGVVDGDVFIFGGEGNPEAASNGVFNQTEVFDVKQNSWKRLPPMKVPRHGTSAVGVGGRIYVPGGGTVEGGGRLVDLFDCFIP